MFEMRRTWGPKPNYPTVISIPPQQHDLVTIAGPCSIESPDQIDCIAAQLAEAGVTYMRGGVYRAGTYPPKSFGLCLDLLSLWRIIADRYKLKIIVEVIDLALLNILDDYADAFQVGARQMQNYALLDLLSNQDKPVTIKRNMGATLDEFLGAAEYLVRNGNRNVILIERGSSTHMNHVRWDLSISTIAAIKQLTSLPIIIDASHGTGRRDLVEPMTLAGIAAGADGFLVEIHPYPDQSLSDSDQALSLDRYQPLTAKAKSIRSVISGALMEDHR